ncbi:MAG: AN1-type zinc finger domain-containing protein [Candidatus Bathyarchaeia archaeon]|nr:hypothetical protein [Candidatus Bathyarchaeota archaeon]
MKCQYCGSNVDLPFRCPFCGGYFCAEHRLPEFHACQGIKRGPSIYEEIERRDEVVRLPFYRKTFSRYFSRLSSRTEIAHLILGTIMVMLVGLSVAIIEVRLSNPLSILLLTFTFASAFIPHELGHKFTAKYYGLWAEFRLSLIGVIITFISIFSPIIKIVSPGAVLVSGEASRKTMGRVALSGPVINIVLSALFFVLGFSYNSLILRIISVWGSMVNAYVSLFNLIPFGILDGAKIFWWNKYLWALVFLLSLMMVIVILIVS